jgi:hypothetical protein
MTHSLQLFLYKVGNGINEHNNFPFIRFRSNADAHEFVTKLKSCPITDISGGFFVLNNPQHLPTIVRKLHMYHAPVRLHPENSQDDRDSSSEPQMRDGYFSMEYPENIRLLKQCDVSNNTNELTGFREYIDRL